MSVSSSNLDVVDSRKGSLFSRRPAAVICTEVAVKASSVAPAPLAPVATVPSVRWVRFTEVVRKLSRLFVFIAEVLFPVPALRRRGPV